MRRWGLPALAAAGLAASLSACGGGSGASQKPDGRAIFAASCSACHGLTGRESAKRQGGDLARFRMTEAQIESFTRIMPARRPLTDAEIRAVSQYVLSVQRRQR